jgi:hypothetical protein
MSDVDHRWVGNAFRLALGLAVAALGSRGSTNRVSSLGAWFWVLAVAAQAASLFTHDEPFRKFQFTVSKLMLVAHRPQGASLSSMVPVLLGGANDVVTALVSTAVAGAILFRLGRSMFRLSVLAVVLPFVTLLVALGWSTLGSSREYAPDNMWTGMDVIAVQLLWTPTTALLCLAHLMEAIAVLVFVAGCACNRVRAVPQRSNSIASCCGVCIPGVEDEGDNTSLECSLLAGLVGPTSAFAGLIALAFAAWNVAQSPFMTKILATPAPMEALMRHLDFLGKYPASQVDLHNSMGSGGLYTSMSVLDLASVVFAATVAMAAIGMVLRVSVTLPARLLCLREPRLQLAASVACVAVVAGWFVTASEHAAGRHAFGWVWDQVVGQPNAQVLFSIAQDAVAPLQALPPFVWQFGLIAAAVVIVQVPFALVGVALYFALFSKWGDHPMLPGGVFSAPPRFLNPDALFA